MKKIMASVVVVVLLLSLILCVACTPKDPQELVIDCAKQLQDRWGDTFEVAGDCGYRNHYTFEGTTYMNTYVAIPFEVKDGDSGEVILRDIAFFVNGNFAGYDSNYDDGSYERWSDNAQLQFLLADIIWLENDFTKVFTKEQINSALGIGVVSGEAVSGEVSGEVA